MAQSSLDGGRSSFWVGRRQFVLPAMIVAFTLCLVVVPLATLIIFSFRAGTPWQPGEFTLEHYTRAYSQVDTYTIFGNTFLLAIASTVLSLAIALFFAFLTERTDMPYRNLAWGLMLVPMAMPGLLFAVSWTFLLSPRIGMFNVWIRDLLGLFGVEMSEGPFDIYSGMPAMIFLEGLRGVTTTFLIVVGGFRAMDPALEEASRTSGASPTRTMFTVTLPLLTPTIMAAAMYSFMTHLESLEIPIIIGLPANVFVFPSYIFFSTQRSSPPEYGVAAALSAAFIVLSIVLVWWYRRVASQTNKFATITGRGYRPRIIGLGRWRLVFFSIFVVYFVLTIVAPTLALLWNSFQPIPMPPSIARIGNMSLQHYADVFGASRNWEAAWNTVLVAVGTGTLTMVLALVMAWVVVRQRFRGSGVLDAVTFLPHALPGVVIAIALIYVFLQPAFSGLKLFDTLSIIILGLTIAYIAFGSRTMNGAMTQIHKEMEEAAMTSGARWRVVIQTIVLPLLLPAFISGWIWVVTHALRNFSIPLLLSGRENRVISVIMWHSWDDGYPGQTSALGVALIVVLTTLTVGGRLLVSRLSKQQR